MALPKRIETRSHMSTKKEQRLERYIERLHSMYRQTERLGGRQPWLGRSIIDFMVSRLDSCNAKLSTPMLRAWHYQRELENDWIKSMGTDIGSCFTAEKTQEIRKTIARLSGMYQRIEGSGARRFWIGQYVLNHLAKNLDGCNDLLHPKVLRTWHYQKELKRPNP